MLHCYDIHYINYTLCTVTLVSEFTDSLRQMKPVFLLSSVFPKTHKCTFTTFYFTFSYSSSNSLQFDIYRDGNGQGAFQLKWSGSRGRLGPGGVQGQGPGGG